MAPFAVRYSQENRYYVMFSAFALLSWWLVLRALRLRRTSAWAWYGAAAAAMQLTHPFAPLVLLLQASLVAAMWWRDGKSVRRHELQWGYGIAVVIGVVLILPWYAWGATKWIPNALDGKSYALNPSGQFAVPVDSDLFKRGAEWLLGNAERPTFLVLGLLIVIFAAPFLARRRDRVVATAAIAYVLAFMLILVPLARLAGTYFAYRRVESLVAPMLLAAAIGIVAIVDRLVSRRVERAKAYTTGAVVAAVLLVLSLVATISYYSTEKTNYRAFARVVHDAPDGQIVVVGGATSRSARLHPGLPPLEGRRPAAHLHHSGHEPAAVGFVAVRRDLVDRRATEPAGHDDESVERPRQDAGDRRRPFGSARRPAVVRVVVAAAIRGRVRSAARCHRRPPTVPSRAMTAPDVMRP